MVYFEPGVPDDTKVTFIKFMHEHLKAKARPSESVSRVRTHVCPHCNEPLQNRRAGVGAYGGQAWLVRDPRQVGAPRHGDSGLRGAIQRRHRVDEGPADGADEIDCR